MRPHYSVEHLQVVAGVLQELVEMLVPAALAAPGVIKVITD
jgi:hypothetical protein